MVEREVPRKLPEWLVDCEFTLSEILQRRALEAPLAVALVDVTRQHEWTNADVWLATSGAIRHLETTGLESGDRVVFMLPKGVAGIAYWFALQHAGCVAVMCSPTVRARELESLMSRTGARAIISSSSATWGTGSADLISIVPLAIDRLLHESSLTYSLPRQTPDGVCVILCTSGSTGAPKLCCHSSRDLLIGGHSLTATAAISGGDIVFSSSDLSFSYGLLANVLVPLTSGAALVIGSFINESGTLDGLERGACSVLICTPSVLKRLTADLRRRQSSGPALRKIILSGSACPPSMLDDVSDVWGPVEVVNVLGATEVFTPFMTAGIHSRDLQDFSPVPGYAVSVVDANGRSLPLGSVGGLEVRGVTSARFWNSERQRVDAPARRTLLNDRIVESRDGVFRYVGRSDDIIVCGGVKLDPVAVETAMMAHPLVLESVCVARPHAIHGQSAVLYVTVVNPGVNTAVADLLTFLRGQLDLSRVVVELVVIDSMLRLENGKIDRNGMRGASVAAGKSPQ